MSHLPTVGGKWTSGRYLHKCTVQTAWKICYSDMLARKWRRSPPPPPHAHRAGRSHKSCFHKLDTHCHQGLTDNIHKSTVHRFWWSEVEQSPYCPRHTGLVNSKSGRFQWPRGLQLFVCWDCGFESHQGHGHLSVVLHVSVTGSLTECVSVCVCVWVSLSVTKCGNNPLHLQWVGT
jgi:hypothetical protein